MSPDSLLENLHQATAHYERALQEHHDASQRYRLAESACKAKEAHAKIAGLRFSNPEPGGEDVYLNYSALGKNETERKALFDVRFASEYEDVLRELEEATAGLEHAKLQLELARVEWDSLRYVVRILELGRPLPS